MLAMRPCNSSWPSSFSQSQVAVTVGARQTNFTTEKPKYARDAIAVVFPMTLGILSNIIALIILARAYFRLRRRSKATFLLFASSLVLTDFAGHVIPGALVLRLYGQKLDSEKPTDAPCQFLGGCMVFFGLCPLFLGCAMAAERCLGVTQPLLHTSLVTTTRTKLSLSAIWLVALCVALLPFFQVGAYTYHYPNTWCFINVLDNTQGPNMAMVLLFSGLGLASLAVSMVCNTISGLTLVRARLRKKSRRRCSAKSHDIEMVVQLVGIMVTSCICWSPLLIFGLMTVTRPYNCSPESDMYYKTLMMTGVRMATWNQILDPWVYILLRRAVLRKVCLITRHQADFMGSTIRRMEVSSFPSLEKKNTINRI